METQLYAGPSYAALAPVGTPVAFRTGAGAGYWPTTAVTVEGVAPGAVATVRVKVWRDAPTYEAAWSCKGESSDFTVTTGGAGMPPSLPANLAGLTSFAICFPEPSTLALGVLGACVLFLRRGFEREN